MKVLAHFELASVGAEVNIFFLAWLFSTVGTGRAELFVDSG